MANESEATGRNIGTVALRWDGQSLALLDQRLLPAEERWMTAEGAAVLAISSELEEVLRISDRVIVMHEGRIAGQVARDDPHFSEEGIMQLATGGE